MKTISDFGRRLRELAQEVIHRNISTSIKIIAGECNIAPSTLYSALNPNGDSHAPSLAVDWIPVIVNETDDITILEMIASECGCEVVRRELANGNATDRLASKFVTASKEVGDLAEALQEAMDDGAISPAEWRKIEKERLEAQAALGSISRPKMDAKK